MEKWVIKRPRIEKEQQEINDKKMSTNSMNKNVNKELIESTSSVHDKSRSSTLLNFFSFLDSFIEFWCTLQNLVKAQEWTLRLICMTSVFISTEN